MASTRKALLEAIKTLVTALTQSDDTTPLFAPHNIYITTTRIAIEEYQKASGGFPACFIADGGGEREPANKVLDRRTVVIVIAVESMNDPLATRAAQEIHTIADRFEDSIGIHSDFSLHFSADSDVEGAFTDNGKTIATKAFVITTTIQRAAKALTSE